MQNEDEIRRIVGRQSTQVLVRRCNRYGLIFLTGHLLTLVVTGSIIFLFRGTGWIWPAMFVHGIIIVHLFAPFHETAHGTAFRTRWLNNFVGWLSGLALMLPPLYFKFEHAAHHSFTQTPGRDPQRIPMAESLGGYLLYATAIPYFRGLFTSLIRHPLGQFTAEERGFLPEKSLPEVKRQAQLMWLFYLCAGLASLLLHTEILVTYWLLPRLLGEPVMRFIRMSEHVGRPPVPDLLQNTRTVVTPAPLRWLNWNMALHAAHHAMPLVPFWALPKLQRILEPHLADVREGYLNVQMLLIKNGLAHAHSNGTN